MLLREDILQGLKSDDFHGFLKKLDNEKVLEQIVPEVEEMKQVGECKYHLVNCFEHSLNALKEFEDILKVEDFFPSHLKKYVWGDLNTVVEDNLTKLDILKLCIFLHDIGKPKAKTVDENGGAHFKDHEKIGADIAADLAEKLNFSQETVEIIHKYVRYHMLLLGMYKSNDLNKDKLFDLFFVLKDETIGVMTLGYVDIVATRKLLDPDEDLGVTKTYMEYVLTNYIYRYYKNKVM